jgi:hypothetical protein
LWKDAEITNIIMGCPSKGKCYRDVWKREGKKKGKNKKRK